LIADRIDRYNAVKETVLKFAPLRMLVRYLPVIFVVPIFVTTASIVQASMICMRVDKFSVVSNPAIQQQLQAHVKTLPGLTNYEIRPINSRFFIVSSENEKCKESSSCYYRLLDLRNGVVKDVFAFQGSGKVLMIASPEAVWSEPLQDEYSAMAFETRENTYLEIRLPRLGNTVFLLPLSPEEIRMDQRICGGYPK
jgi:hypothetical protein